MIINSDITLAEFHAWQGAKDTKEVIIEAGMQYAFESMIDDLYPKGLTETELNDLLWHDTDWVYEQLNICSACEQEMTANCNNANCTYKGD